MPRAIPHARGYDRLVHHRHALLWLPIARHAMKPPPGRLGQPVSLYVCAWPGAAQSCRHAIQCVDQGVAAYHSVTQEPWGRRVSSGARIGRQDRCPLAAPRDRVPHSVRVTARRTSELFRTAVVSRIGPTAFRTQNARRQPPTAGQGAHDPHGRVGSSSRTGMAITSPASFWLFDGLDPNPA